MKRTTRFTWRSCLLILGVIGLITSLIHPLPGGFTLNLNDTVNAGVIIPGPAIEGTVYGVTSTGNLITFNQASPSAIIRTTAITDMQPGDQIVAIDYRPRTGQLFGISQNSRIYTINPMTGAALGAAVNPLNPTLNGTSFGFDFNPAVDRLRVVSNAGQNLRINPNDGTVVGGATDTALSYAAGDTAAGQTPNIVGSAYTNNFDGATSTTLYGIDSNLDTLVLQGSIGGTPNSPNGGVLTTVGALGVDTSDQVGFDITGPGGLALASLTPSGGLSSSLYTINLQTGAAKLIGPIGVGLMVLDIAAVVRVETVYGLTASNKLLTFSSGTPGTIASTTAITGLAAGENLVGIDFRPLTGQLYAASTQNRIYTINPTTGAATPVGGAPLNPPLNGASFGFDFNPAVDRLRVVSNAGQNLRVNPLTGAVAMADTNLTFAAGDANATATPSIVGEAYTNNQAGVTSTTLYGIDSNLDVLVLQGSIGGTPTSPNTGMLTTVGALGVNTTDQVGFDIAPATDAAFASLTLSGGTTSNLYTINLNSGMATLIGTIGGGEVMRDIAIAPRVEIVYAATNSNKLISFNALAPGTLLSTATITGFVGDETILGIDFRPANGQLFAIASSSRIYLVNPLTGVATQVGTGITNPQLNGIGYGFDFNPVPDRIRIVSTATHNLRFVPDTGASAGIDPFLTYAASDIRAGQTPFVDGAAYDNSFAGSTSTTLYGIDSNFDSLVRQGSPGGSPISPNSGQLFTIGPLGFDTNEMVGFDIADVTNNAYASLTVGGISQLYRINLITGAASLIAPIGGGEIIRGIAVMNSQSTSTQPAGIAVANAASFATDVIAPDSLAAVYGNFQTIDGKTYVTGSQLSTSLGGVQLTVNGTEAQLLAARNDQINFILPEFSGDGPATVVVTSANGTTNTGTINMARAATGIFSMNLTGQGTAAAIWTTDGVNYYPVVNPDGTEREASAGTASKPTYLVLYTTGLRNAPAADPNDGNGMAEAVTATVQNVQAQVVWAGRAPGFKALDQVNLIIPPQLAGVGTAAIKLTVAGRASNTVTIKIGN